MIPTYGSSRIKLPDSAFSATTIAGATTAARTINLYLSAENRQGLNQLSEPKQLVLSAGQGAQITINSSAIAFGEDVFWLVISGETTGNPEDAVRLTSFKAKQDDQQTPNNLPATIDLTTDLHFNGLKSYADFASLPNTGVLDGAIAKTEDTNNYYRYDSTAFTDSDGYKSYGTTAEGANNWVRYYRAFSTYVADTQGGIGSDVALVSVERALKIPKKVGNADSTRIIYWLNNGFENDGQSPIVNACYNFAIAINGDDYTGTFAEKINYTLLGFVDRETGDLDTSVDLVGQLEVWSPTSPIKINNLPRNYAAAIAVVLDYDEAEMLGKLPTVSSTLELNIIKVGNNSGKLSAIANYIGDSVAPSGDKLLIVPGLTRLSGQGTVAMPGAVGFEIDTDATQEIAGVLPDTANQIAAISGAGNGLITMRSQNDTLAYSERVRAYISTESGLSNLSVVSPELVVNNNSLSVTVVHPINSSNKGIIRADYVDNLLAGTELGRFTPTHGYLFADIDSTFYQSALISLAVSGTNPNQVTNLDLADLTAIAQLPVQSDPAFSLYEAVSITVASSGAGTTTGTVKFYWAYSYESPNSIATKIRHDLAGVIPTAKGTLGEVLGNSLLASNNLSDVDDRAVSLANLNGVALAVFNILENTVTGILDAIANFGDVVSRNVGTAIGNVIALVDDGGTPKLPAVDGSLLTGINFGSQDSAIAALQQKTIAVTLTPKVLAAGDFPYTLIPDDYGKELIVSGITGNLIIPDDISAFDDNFLTILSNDGGSNILIDREDGQQTDLLFTNNKQRSQSIGRVAIGRRSGTNVIRVDGLLE